MSKPAFTPGPWKWDKHGDLRGKNRNAVINPNLRGDVLSGVNREADAALIAAAPAIYEALNLLQQTHKHRGPCRGRQCLAMNAALALARGES